MQIWNITFVICFHSSIGLRLCLFISPVIRLGIKSCVLEWMTYQYLIMVGKKKIPCSFTFVSLLHLSHLPHFLHCLLSIPFHCLLCMVAKRLTFEVNISHLKFGWQKTTISGLDKRRCHIKVRRFLYSVVISIFSAIKVIVCLFVVVINADNHRGWTWWVLRIRQWRIQIFKFGVAPLWTHKMEFQLKIKIAHDNTLLCRQNKLLISYHIWYLNETLNINILL